jgi:hypothetical protein
MHIRHRRHVMMNEWQAGDVLQLLAGRVLDRHAAGPGPDRLAFGLDHLELGHGRPRLASD